MNTMFIENILKDDDLGLLKDESIKYGILYKGSYWTGYTPIQAVIKLFESFPKYRVTKGIFVSQLEETVPGLWVSKFCSPLINFTVEELKRVRIRLKNGEF